MTIDLQQAIRNALAGSSGQQPVDAATLRKFGTSVDIAAALTAMCRSGEANTARVMRGGKFADMYWLTGMAGQLRDMRPLPPMRQLPDATRPSSVNTAQPKTATTANESRETTMNWNTKNKPQRVSATRKAILDKVIVHPGIAKIALIKHVLAEVPDTTEAKVVSAIGNLITREQIHAKGPRGKQTMHPSAAGSVPQNQQAMPPAPASKVRPGKVVTGAEAAALRGDPTPAAEPAPTAVAPHVTSDTKAPHSIPAALLREIDDEPFTLMISDDNHLHVGIGEEMYHFNEVQTARLHRFMNRVQLGAAA